MNTTNFDALTDVSGTPIYFENGKGYLICSGAKYVSMTESAATRYLRSKGFLNATIPGDDIKLVERALLKIQMEKNVDYAGALAGKKPGIYTIGSSRVLVTSGPRIIEPDAQVSWNLLRRIVEEMFSGAGEEQLTHFYGWLSMSYKTLRDGSGTMGQALVLAGPRDCGKTLLQAIITACLGGRAANPFPYMSGATDFNRDLFGSECLMFGDEISSTDPRARRNFGSRLKQFTVNEDQFCHAKGRDAITLRPYWRLVFSVNDEPENLMVLPPLDESIVDKIMILRVIRPALFSTDEWSSNRAVTWERIQAELPGFIAHIDSFTIPPAKLSKRFGICTYHDPEIRASLGGLSQEVALLELIDTELFAAGGTLTSWSGTGTELAARLTQFGSAVKVQASNLLYWHSAAGTFLSRLCTQFPDRIRKHQKNKALEYTIWSPRADAGFKPLPARGAGDPSPFSRFPKMKAEVVENGKEGEGVLSEASPNQSGAALGAGQEVGASGA